MTAGIEQPAMVTSGATPFMDKLFLSNNVKPTAAVEAPPPKVVEHVVTDDSIDIDDIEIDESDLIEPVNVIPSDLLKGLTFVLSGVFEFITRQKLEIFINTHGGHCTSSISGKTSYLVVGVKLEDGRQVTEGNKYRTARDKNI